MEKICDYGCGNKAIKQFKNGKFCCSEHLFKCPNMKKKSHTFTKKDRLKSNQKSIEESLKKAFVKNSKYSNEFIKPRFIKYYAKGYLCYECGITDWNNKKLVLELDHIDGDDRNNEPSNLRLLCPNCHSQTETFRGRNINTGFKKVSDEKLINAINSTKNTREALLEVGLAAKGANYTRVAKIKEKYKL